MKGKHGSRSLPRWGAAALRRLAGPGGAALGIALLASGCALWGDDPTDRPPDARVRSGEALFERHCASCHGLHGRGDGPMASLLETEPADLTRIAARRGGVFPEPAIQRIIDGRDPVVGHGTREMPVWGERFGEGLPSDTAETAPRAPVLLLVEHLKSIQRPGEGPED